MNADQTPIEYVPTEVLRINATLSTETLEDILRTLSNDLEMGKMRFQEIRDELRRRKETRDEQPLPKELTAEQQHQEELGKLRNDVAVLTNKSIAMESEQAKLVVEAVIAREALREAEDRLALLAKQITMVPKKAIDELTAALCDVPPGGASGDAPAWIIRLHRASCEVARMQVITNPMTTLHLENMRNMLEKHIETDQ